MGTDGHVKIMTTTGRDGGTTSWINFHTIFYPPFRLDMTIGSTPMKIITSIFVYLKFLFQKGILTIAFPRSLIWQEKQFSQATLLNIEGCSSDDP